MAKVLGIGGVFFKAEDPDGLKDWYRRALGLKIESWGAVMFEPLPSGVTVWSPFAADTTHFAPSTLDTMINFVVDDLDGVLARAAAEGAEPIGREDQDEQGRFAWLLDPSGRKIELWQPAPED
jgi:predicted enzyme related to lactoylglutathione lyase